MDRDLYNRFKDHPIRQILNEAANGAHIHDDRVDDLNLPKRLRTALDEAIERVTPDEKPGYRSKPKRMGTGSPDHLASELVAALPEHHETARQKLQRRAEQGDPEAQALVQNATDQHAEIARRIYEGEL